MKARRPRWRAEQHPRDPRGRFVEVGDPVRLTGGTRGTFQGVDSRTGRVRVRVEGEQRDRLVLRSQVQFDGKPAPKKPASAPQPSGAAQTTAPTTDAPLPPTGQAETAKETLLAGTQRAAINELGMDDADSPWSPTVRAGAAALRAKKPLTAAQAEALVVAIRDAATTPGIPAGKKNALLRGAERLDSLAVRLRGFDPAKAPGKGTTKVEPDQVKDGDFIALPTVGGGVEVVQVTEAKDYYGNFKYTVTNAAGAKETRFAYPGTDVRRFDGVTSVSEALKLLDDAEGKPGKPKALYDDPAVQALFDAVAAAAHEAAKDMPDTDGDTTGAEEAADVGKPGAVTPNVPWYDKLSLSGNSSDPIPVTDLTVEGYTVASGVAWRQDGRSVLVELKPGETQADAVARGKKSADLLREVLKSAPADKAALQRGLALLQGSNPADSYWAKKYDMPGFHSTMTGGFGTTTVWGGNDPQPTDLAHEFGHTIDSTAFGTDQWLSEAPGPVVAGQETSWEFAAADDHQISGFYANGRFKETRLHPFVKPITLGEKGVTDYGSVDPREDFAESVRLWMKDRREGKVGYDPTTGDNLRFSDLFPERAKQLDAVFGTTTDFDTPARKKRRKEAEDAYLENLKAGNPPPLAQSMMKAHALTLSDLSAAQVAANERYAKEKADAKAKAEAEAAAAKLAAEQAAGKAAAEKEALEQVATITTALESGKLAAADAKKFRAAVTRYKNQLRAQGFSEAEVAQMAAAYETSLMMKQFGLGEYGVPKVSPEFTKGEASKAHSWLKEAGTEVHPLATDQHGFTAGQAKSNIAAELASRLNNPGDWEKARAWKSHHGDEWGAFDDLTEQQRQDMLAAEVSARVQKWAGTSGDSDQAAVMMQEAVKREFGTTGHSAPRMSQEEFEAMIATSWEATGPWFQRVARVMYEHTQDEFKKAGITHISAYRGMYFSKSKVPAWAETTGDRPVELQPANSWSALRSTSVKFAGSKYMHHQIMMTARIPVELVLGSARTGFGCLNEQEFVVFDSDGDVHVDVINTKT